MHLNPIGYKPDFFFFSNLVFFFNCLVHSVMIFQVHVPVSIEIFLPQLQVNFN